MHVSVDVEHTEPAGAMPDKALTRRLGKHLAGLAKGWLASGATSFSVWQYGSLVRRWPPDVQLPHDIVAPIRAGREVVGEIRVSGVALPEADARLQAEAELLSRIATLELELESMTAEMVDRQDQLLAMYDLAQSLRNNLTVDQALHSLAAAARRLVGTEGAFSLLVPPSTQPTIARVSAAFADDDQILELFELVQRTDREHHWEARDALPGGVDNVLLVPVRVRETVLAGLGLVNKHGGFTSPDVKMARAIAAQGGAQIETALLYGEMLAQAALKTELDLATQIQRQMLPQSEPRVPGLDIVGRSESAWQMGGDLYAFIESAARPFTFVVGDVAGKGMSAAMLMAITVTIATNAATFLPAPTAESLMARMNQDLYEPFTNVGMFATAFVGQFDPVRRTVSYANAGHSPVIYCPYGGPARMLEADCTAIGVLPTSFCGTQTIRMGPGDLLVVATDGFAEARNPLGELFGYDRLLGLCDELAPQPAAAIASSLFDVVRQFGKGQPQDDDQTLVVLKGVEE